MKPIWGCLGSVARGNPLLQTGDRNTGTAKFPHWLVVVLLTTQFIVEYTMEEIRSNEPPTTLINFHFSMGLTILAVVLIRLVWRLTHPAPK